MRALGLTDAAALLMAAMTFGPASADDAPPVIDGQPLNPLQSVEPSDFSSFVKRPLFRPTRLPVEQSTPTEATADQETSPSPEFTLLGVTSSPDGIVASIVTAEKPSRSFREGEDIEGWHLQDVDGSSVTLTRNGKTIELRIFSKDGSITATEDPGAEPDGRIVFGTADTVEQNSNARVIENK